MAPLQVQAVVALLLAVCCFWTAGVMAALNVYILPHSHDDVGWVRTPDEYFDDFVKDIYTTSIAELQHHPERRFQSVEQAYFSRWWYEATPEQQAAARRAIANGQLEFAVGGWVMPDEAVTDYPDTIETMALGHEFIVDTFGVKPRYGFQVDPFGASTAFAMYSAQMGFDAHIIDRINYWDKGNMETTQSLEFIWRTSNIVPNTDMFTHTMDQYGYCVPFIPVKTQLDLFCKFKNQTDCPGGGFLWDGDDSHPAPYWQSNPPYPGVNASNVKLYADFMIQNIRDRSAFFATNTLLWPFGCDFQYFNATRMFDSMDRIMEFVAANNGPNGLYPGVHLQYGTLSEYFHAMKTQAEQDDVKWPSRGTSDFLPYSSSYSPTRTWTGYFTSHSQLKGHVRERGAQLRTVQALLSAAAMKSGSLPTAAWEGLQALRAAAGVLQHHDAVTGTEGPGLHQQSTPGQIGDVVVWYENYLTVSGAAADQSASIVLAQLLTDNRAGLNLTSDLASRLSPSLSAGLTVPVVVVNSLARTQSWWVVLPVPRTDVHVTSSAGTSLPFQVLQNMHALPGEPAYNLFVFVQNVGALQPVVLMVGVNAHTPAPEGVHPKPGVPHQISNGVYMLQFHNTTGQLSHITNVALGIMQPVTSSLMAYTSASNVTANAVSGSYIFMPAGDAGPIAHGVAPSVSYTSGTYVQEVHYTYADGSISTLRLLRPALSSTAPVGMDGSEAVHIISSVGPLEGNTEMIIRWQTGLNTVPAGAPGIVSTFTSDNNGHTMQHRETNATLTNLLPNWPTIIAATYAPLVRQAYIADTHNGTTLSVLSSRSHGVVSLRSGELEVMLHRRELQDDGLGACFPLNENTTRPDQCPWNRVPLNVTTRVTPSLWLTLDHGDTLRRGHIVQRVNNPPLVLAGSPTEVQPLTGTTSGALLNDLPDNTYLLTLRPRYSNATSFVLRLQHIAAESTPSAQDPVKVDIASLLSGYALQGIEERTLTGMWPVNEVNRTAWPGYQPFQPRDPVTEHKPIVSLLPTEIRSFLVTVAQPTPPPVPPHSPSSKELWWIAGLVGGIIVVLVILQMYLTRCDAVRRLLKLKKTEGDERANLLNAAVERSSPLLARHSPALPHLARDRVPSI